MLPPFFIPPVKYVRPGALDEPGKSLREICKDAGISCRATGDWTERPVAVRASDASLWSVSSETGDGAVRIEIPKQALSGADTRDIARCALLVLAYHLHDLVAKESVRGQPWARTLDG